jgi:DNA repair and recombination RAD54-like protein
VVDSNESAERHFSAHELKQLFKYNEVALSETHNTFKCKRCKDGKQFVKAPAMLYGDTSTSVSFSPHGPAVDLIGGLT